MSHDGLRYAAPDQPRHAGVAALQAGMAWVNRLILRVSMLALVAASLVLTYSVVTRFVFKTATDWQDEVAVFLLVGATFLCMAFVQEQRGHVGIEALSAWLSPRVNAVRVLLTDALSALFCLFFSWKSWTLLYEAWTEGQTTSSSFGAPLWIPYALMAVGMSLLTLQLGLQVLVRLTHREGTHHE